MTAPKTQEAHENFDLLTWIHSLQWSVFCAEATPTEFERRFTEVMRAINPDFARVQPWGASGDKKNDGMLFHEGTVYQVYSPDELTQAKMAAKIREDYTGAVRNWGKRGMSKWVFVYNTRRGLAPDVLGTLEELLRKRGRKPPLPIELMDERRVWGLIRELGVQVRSEILGPPPEGASRLAGAGLVAGTHSSRPSTERVVVIHDIMSHISMNDAEQALHPLSAFPVPVPVRPHCGDGLWASAAASQERIVADLVSHSQSMNPRFAVFSISPIPLVVHLGFRFSDRIPVDLFQYDRDRKSWNWSEAEPSPEQLRLEVAGFPDGVLGDAGEVVIAVSLSDLVDRAAAAEHVPHSLATISITASEADRSWLQHPDQLTQFTRVFRSVLKRIGHTFPNARTLHLFAAAPTPACFAMGQCINPRMTAPVALYQYDRQRAPRYEHVLTLKNSSYEVDLTAFHYTSPPTQ